MVATDNSSNRRTKLSWPPTKAQLRAALLDGWERSLKLALWSHRQLVEILPKGLYTRALIIIIAPIVLLEGVVAFIFMERHWQAVTRRLSEATARDVAAVVELYKGYEKKDNYSSLAALARDRLSLQVQILPPGDLPSVQPKPFFSLLDKTLSNEIRLRIKDTPFWIDTVGDSDLVEIKIKLKPAILSFVAKRSQTYASNSHIFLVWMVVTSVVLLTVAILFLRNQIRPILRLADAADAFGKGRPFPEDFQPRGAREVRQAAIAFLEMRDRITQHVDQRTTMLAGVSHDLRTVLTRFKLELALLKDGPEVQALSHDVNEMQHMLEEYLAFAQRRWWRRGCTNTVARVDRGSLQPATRAWRQHRVHAEQAPARTLGAAQATSFQARADQSGEQCRALRRSGCYSGRQGTQVGYCRS